jgi:ribosomal protein S14
VAVGGKSRPVAGHPRVGALTLRPRLEFTSRLRGVHLRPRPETTPHERGHPTGSRAGRNPNIPAAPRCGDWGGRYFEKAGEKPPTPPAGLQAIAQRENRVIEILRGDAHITNREFSLGDIMKANRRCQLCQRDGEVIVLHLTRQRLFELASEQPVSGIERTTTTPPPLIVL